MTDRKKPRKQRRIERRETQRVLAVMDFVVRDARRFMKKSRHRYFGRPQPIEPFLWDQFTQEQRTKLYLGLVAGA